MFEGLATQAVAWLVRGYLGRFVKGIQKDQLKIGLWKEEILLENVELILEAFEYLQLPFALKNGRIRKLSIKIPWKRLGRDPIIFVVEDVFLCACQRGEDEWTKDSVEKRELAGKLAKLDAIELSKFSRRVSDNHVWESFISYIKMKILDSFQISIRNVHIVYIGSHSCQGDFVFGLKFSTLTVTSDTAKHKSTVSSSGKFGSGQVSKVLEISSLGLYCNMIEAAQRTVNFSAMINSQNYFSMKSDNARDNFLLHPFDVRISLLVNRSGKSSCAYAVDIETTTLAVTLNEMQLHQILSLFDYFSVCALRERYGQFRPSLTFLPRKHIGWQRVWWQYAQNAVLLDVRRKLWKTSWRNLGKRIVEHQRYVSLYKRKLALIEQEQVVTNDILLELEEMDRQCALDDILNYRSEAEQKMQDLLKTRTAAVTHVERFPYAAYEKPHMDDRSSSSARGWLNWLSLGMLGASGTAESSTFTSVVSDATIKDIYEATEFNPAGSVTEDPTKRDDFLTTSVKVKICQIGATIFSKYSKKMVEAVFNGISAECQFCETSATVIVLIDSIKLINPFNGNILLAAKKAILDDNSSLHLFPFVNFHIIIQKFDQSFEPFVKVVLQSFEATFESEFYLEVLELFNIVVSFQFLHRRVLHSLNGLKDFKSRLSLKTEYISHNYRKLKWDIFIHSSVIKFPFSNEVIEPSYMLWESERVFCKSMPKTGKIPDLVENSQSYDYELKSYLTDLMNNGMFSFQLQDLYDHYELGLADFQVKLVMPNSSATVQILEKCNPIFTARLCTFMDEPLMKPFEVHCFVRFLYVRFSPTILQSFLKLHELSEKEYAPTSGSNLMPSEIDKLTAPNSSSFSFSIKLDYFRIHVDLQDDLEYDTAVLFTFHKASARLISGESKELRCLMETIMFSTSNLKHEQDTFTLCSARSGSSNARSQDPEYDINDFSCSNFFSEDYCFQLFYRIHVESNSVRHEYDISLHEVDLHVYPRLCGLLGRFLSRISVKSFSTTSVVDFIEEDQGDYKSNRLDAKDMKFGFSNFYTSDPSLCRCISVDNFPFVTIQHSDPLSNIDTSIIQNVNVFQNVGVIDEQCSKIHNFSVNKGPTNLDYSTMQNVNGSMLVDRQLSLCYDIVFLDIKIKKLKVHFHDSSSILGVICSPQFRSAITLQWTKCWDVLVSTEGISLSSYWSSHEVVWGPSSIGISPVLNIRVKKEKNEATVEVSFGVQHVSCILKAEFLALLTGYFSLPEWTSKGIMKADKHRAKSNDEFDIYLNENLDIVYKFEILDSILILPVENNIDLVLQVHIPRLYCNFAATSSSENVFKDIPLDCMVPSDVIINNKLHFINLFGKNLSLSVVLVKDKADSPLKYCQYTSNEHISFIEHFDADLWLRIPCERLESVEICDFPALIMMRVDSCNLIGEDEYFITALEAAVDVAGQFSLVGKEAEYFTSDVVQFMQLKEKIKEGVLTITGLTVEPFIIMKLCIKALSINFLHLNTKQSSSLETMAKAYVRLDCFATLQNGLPRSLSVDIYSLLFHSFLSDVLLASFSSDGDETSPFFINFSRIDHKTEILFGIPALDIWLHLPDWDRICSFLGSFKGKLNMIMLTTAIPESSPQSAAERHITLYSSSENVMQDTVLMTIKSESIMISFHLPIWDKEEKSEKPIAMQEQNFHALSTASAEDVLLFQSKPYKHLKLILQSKFCKLSLRKNHMELKCNLEKMRTMLEMGQDNKLYSLPFIYISHVKLEAEIHIGGEGLIQVFVEVQIDSTDVGLSYQIFKFWSHCQFEARETAVSRMLSPCIVVKVRLTKGALLLSDGRGNFHGPILEILMKSMAIQLNQKKDSLEVSGFSDILINYNNIDKVIWEPLVEPWSFQVSLTRKGAGNILLGQSATTVVCMESTNKLNLNITEPLVEAIFRLWKMVTDAFNQSGEVHESVGNIKYQPNVEMNIRRYAPYILRNETSLPLKFHVFRGTVNTQEAPSLANRDFTVVQPGFSLPIYVEETSDEQFFRHRTLHSSELLIEKKLNAASHHMISIFFDGTSGPSIPMSMDLVGRRCFEMNITNTRQSRDNGRDENASNYSWMTEERQVHDYRKGLEVPVVFEVSMLHYSKMIRLYSTVILLNSTSMPLELRFDIPFGVSPKILDPILPGQELPLPLHLAETGRIRWRPVGKNYTWSEAQSLSNVLLKENRPGFFRSFVCYHVHPTSDPFRCCISVQDFDLSMPGIASPLLVCNVREKLNFKSGVKGMHKPDFHKKHRMHQVKLTAPLLVKNYLPVSLSLLLESGGVTRSLKISEGKCASFFAFDSMHDLEFTYQIEGYKPVISKFPRAESFSQMSNCSESKYFLVERNPVYPCGYDGPLSVTLEKTLDSSCGAREIAISVSYLLYNCTGLLLAIVNENQDHNGIMDVIPSSYQLKDQEQLEEKQGLAYLSYQSNSFQGSFCGSSTLTGDNAMPQSRLFPSSLILEPDDMISIYSSCKIGNAANSTVYGCSKYAKPYMYSPLDYISASDLLVRLAVSSTPIRTTNMYSPSWSIPFPLFPSSSSANVTIPKPNSSGAFLISASSVIVAQELSGRTKAITFQPRYVICNACKKDLSYKQKGTNNAYSLGVGKHSHLHWSDTSRDFLLSLRFNEMGWQWSGSFLPDRIGDIQVKMRNHISGELSIVRVEVQNADMAFNDENLILKSNGSSSTHLILLSDDKTGFIPCRIDNFSMERLRIYQHKCESVETVVLPYTSAKYAWDEPCYPHRIVVEVPGERILGTYNLDNVQCYVPVYLLPTSEKPERKLYVSVHAEGTTKVLSIIDSSYHIVRDMNGTNFLGFKDKRKSDQRQCHEAHYSEVIKICFPFIGISLMSSTPQELIFACARETTVVLMQSSEQQKILSEIHFLQIDSQLPDTPYPIILSSENENKGRPSNHPKTKENLLHVHINSESTYFSCEPVVCFSAAKWRKPDVSLVSFEYICLRLAPLCFELEEQILVCLFDFLRTVNSRVQRTLQKNFEQGTLGYCSDASHKFARGRSYMYEQYNLLRPAEFIVTGDNDLLPFVVPLGAPWQEIYLLARRKKKIYVEVFELAPIELSLSFSSTPLITRTEGFTEMENLTRISSNAFQRGIMALADVEGVPVHLRQLRLEHLMASPHSIQDILIRHYMRQLLHEIYKLFGSAGVIGNPIGFARNVKLGIKDFLSVSGRGIVQSPFGVFVGVVQGSKSIFSNTIYALSSAATQFSKAAHKGIVAFTFEEQTVTEMDKQLQSIDVNGKAVLNEFLEGLTGLLQSPIKGAEKHGLPGVISGIAMGTSGLIARPVASILKATAKTAQSIRNRSSPHQSNRRRIRLPRPLARELPLSPYSWEEAVGVSMLRQADMGRLKDEKYVMCAALRKASKFVVVTERLVLVVSSPCLAGLETNDFSGVPSNMTWIVEMEMSLESVVHIDRTDDVLDIVGADVRTKHKKGRSGSVPWCPPVSVPFMCLSLELAGVEEAEDALQVLLSTIELGKERRWGGIQVLHRSNLV